ncbi:MAG TPA: hypothetical protein DIW64_13625 [Cellvibrio sp.]|nr:hypothetical protein [Cellvibrio sp.]
MAGEKRVMSAPIPKVALRHFKLNGFVFGDLLFFIMVSLSNIKGMLKYCCDKKARRYTGLKQG